MRTITTTGTITNCIPSRWNGMQALFTDNTNRRHVLGVAKGVGTKGIKSPKGKPACMAKVEVTYTVNETTGTKLLIAYKLI